MQPEHVFFWLLWDKGKHPYFGKNTFFVRLLSFVVSGTYATSPLPAFRNVSLLVPKHPQPKAVFPNSSSSHLAVLQRASSLANMEVRIDLVARSMFEKSPASIGKKKEITRCYREHLKRNQVIQWFKWTKRHKYTIEAKLVFWGDFFEEKMCIDLGS